MVCSFQMGWRIVFVSTRPSPLAFSSRLWYNLNGQQTVRVIMAEKDISEKILESYNDVFADIVNVLLFNGEKVIDPF